MQTANETDTNVSSISDKIDLILGGVKSLPQWLQIVYVVAVGMIMLGGLGFILARVAVVIGALSAARIVFSVLLVLGFIVLLGDGVWFLSFKSIVRVINNATKNPPIKICPTCGANLSFVQEDHTTTWGRPRPLHLLTCPNSTTFESWFPFTSWTITVGDSERNSDFAWLYDGQTLSTDKVALVASGGHTTPAQKKLWNRLLENRSRVLAEIASGKPGKVKALDTQMILAGQGVDFQVRPAKRSLKTGLSCEDGEELWVWAAPVTLAEQRTKQNIPYLAKLDTGEFFITSLRYGFRGTTKSLDKKLDEITDVQSREKQVAISRKRRKTAEFFLGVDGPVVASILNGLMRES